MEKLFGNLQRFRKNIALSNLKGESLTYSDILKISDDINYKINKKSVVLMICKNSIESIAGYISFIRTENLLILLDASYKEDFAYQIIKKFKPNYIYLPKNHLKKYLKEKIYSFNEYEIYKTAFKKDKKINFKNLLLLTTSGTTQNPKLVRLSNLNLLKNTQNIVNYLKIKPNHTTITTMPMGYSYGLSIINSHLYSGSKILLNNKTLFDKMFWNAIEKHKVTSFGGVPRFYEILKRLKIENFNFKSIKYLTQAGGQLSLNAVKYYENICRKKKIKFFIMYGQTEASPRISYLHPDKLSQFPGSIGKPLKNTYLNIVDEKKKKIKEINQIGELVFYGKNVSLGYADNIKDLYKGDVNRGVLFTGDYVIKNKKGFYFITGRKNRFIKISGVRINIDDIENYLKLNKVKGKILQSNNKLDIVTSQDLDFEAIKDKIFQKFGIRQNDIIFNRKESFVNSNNFKMINYK